MLILNRIFVGFFFVVSTMLIFFCVHACLWNGLLSVLIHHGHRVALSDVSVL